MADATLQILGLGTGPVPLEYTVPGGPSLTLLAVKADFDGSAAGSDFVPMVELVSTAGRVMADGVGSKITAGGSASVTFAPFLGAAVAAASPVDNQTFEDLQNVAPVTITSLNSGNLTWAHATGSHLLDLTSTTVPTVVAAGLYEVHTAVQFPAAYTIGKELQARLSLGQGLANQQNVQGSWWIGSGGFALTGQNHMTPGLSAVCYLPVGGKIQLIVWNGDTVSRAFSSDGYSVKKIG